MTPELKQLITDLTTPYSGKCLEGWLTTERALQMAELVLRLKPDVCLDLGVFGGRSLIVQALACKINKRGIVYGIDPWRLDDCLEGETDAAAIEWWKKIDLHDIHRGCMEAIWKYELNEYAVVIRSQSQNAKYLFGPCSIDVALIDGCHNTVACVRDVNTWLPRMKKNGYVWFDDCTWEQTRPAVDILKSKCVEISNDGQIALFCNKSPQELVK